MDVKKPGPFFEASPNNFYLDKIISEEENEAPDDDNTSVDVKKVDKNTTNKVNDNDQGQQEYEIPMSTSMEKRADTVSKNLFKKCNLEKHNEFKKRRQKSILAGQYTICFKG